GYWYQTERAKDPQQLNLADALDKDKAPKDLKACGVLNNGVFLARASSLAYELDAMVKQVTTAWGGRQTQVFSSNSAQAFVTKLEKAIVVAFRGTEQRLEDFVADAEFALKPSPEGVVHQGFLASLLDIRDQVDAAMKTVSAENT